MPRVVIQLHPMQADLLDLAAGRETDNTAGTKRHIERGCRTCTKRLKKLSDLVAAGREAEALERTISDEHPAFSAEHQAFLIPFVKARMPLEEIYRISQSAGEPAEAILAAARISIDELVKAIRTLDGTPCRPFALLYACQKGDALVASDPARASELGQIVFDEAATLTDAHEDKKTANPVPRQMVQAEALLLQSRGLLQLGHAREALEAVAPARRLFSESGDIGFGAALCDFCEGQAATFARDLSTGERLLNSALKVFADFGQEALVSRTEGALGTVFMHRREFDRALHHLDHALESITDPSVMTGALLNRGTVLARLGRFDEARATYARALTLGRKHGFASRIQIIRNGLAEIDFFRKNYARALAAFRKLARLALAACFDVDYIFARLYVAECLGRLGRETEMQSEIESLRFDVRSSPFAPSPAMLELFACLDQGQLDADLVGHVRQYLEDQESGLARPYKKIRVAG